MVHRVLIGVEGTGHLGEGEFVEVQDRLVFVEFPETFVRDVLVDIHNDHGVVLRERRIQKQVAGRHEVRQVRVGGSDLGHLCAQPVAHKAGLRGPQMDQASILIILLAPCGTQDDDEEKEEELKT